MHVSNLQLALLGVAVAFFVTAWVTSLLRIRRESEKLRITTKASVYWGVLFSAILLVWHSISRGDWLPLEDNFDALIWLGLLQAGFILYMQRVRPLRGLDWFLLPVVILLLICAGIFGSTNLQSYEVRNLWLWTHRAAAYGGTAAFAVAFAVGALYLILHNRLRTKKSAPTRGMGSLERLEHLSTISVTLGLSLLTIGAITGFAWWIDRNQSTHVTKVILTGIIWLVYAAVLHSPINPALRGPRAAVLSVVGFCLIVGTVVAVQLM